METQQEEKDRAREFARKVHDSLVGTLLPQLHRYLTKKDADGDITLRVPVALAVVRLLQALDENSLHAQLPKLVTKVCLRRIVW